MKIILCIICALISTDAFASSAELIYRCDYTIVRPNMTPFVISGNIIPADAQAPDRAGTYLTLAPNELSHIALEARILFTYWHEGDRDYWYNPITLHRPGESASPAASTTIDVGQPGELAYTDSDGTLYTVHCNPR